MDFLRRRHNFRIHKHWVAGQWVESSDNELGGSMNMEYSPSLEFGYDMKGRFVAWIASGRVAPPYYVNIGWYDEQTVTGGDAGSILNWIVA